MPQKSPIEWTDYTSNPVAFRRKSDGKRGWHCVNISPGCANCYSGTIDGRFGFGLPYNKASSELVEPFVPESEVKGLLKLKGSPKVFVEDMSDLFLDLITDEMIAQVYAVMAVKDEVTFQVLTKRPERARALLTGADFGHKVHLAIEALGPTIDRTRGDWSLVSSISNDFKQGRAGRLKNVWHGVSVEDQKRVVRVNELLQIPSAVRFLSVEPLLGPVDLSRWFHPFEISRDDEGNDLGSAGGGSDIDWVIVGGESGKGARPCDLAWIRSIVAQCKAAGVQCFVKQLGAHVAARNDEVSDWFGQCGHLSLSRTGRFQGATGRVTGFHDPKGGNIAEWPDDLRVREMPGVPS